MIATEISVNTLTNNSSIAAAFKGMCDGFDRSDALMIAQAATQRKLGVYGALPDLRANQAPKIQDSWENTATEVWRHYNSPGTQMIGMYILDYRLDNFSGVDVALALTLRTVSSQDPTFENYAPWGKHVNVVFNEVQLAPDRLNYGNYVPMVTLSSTTLRQITVTRPVPLKSGFSWYLSRDYSKKN